jgi:Asp/Glu/hydantoin racemase
MPSVDGVEHLSCSLRPPTLDDIQSAFVETSVSDTIDNNDETQASTLDQPANGDCTACPGINSIDSMERGESVEEIFRASLNFDRSSSFCFSGSLPLFGASLYPTAARIEDADGISTTAQLEQGKREQSENIRVESTYAEASLNTLTEEAVVLGSARMSDDPWDEMTVEDREILAMKRAAYAGERSDPLVAQNIKKHGQEATVVAISEYDVHPNEIVQDAVRAELVGQDFTRTVSNAMDNENVESTEADEFTVSAVFSALRTVDNEATEATVIDSAPLASEEDIPSWKHTEEAQVLVLDTSLPLIDVKPAAVDFSEYSNSGIEPIADQEAEVLGIQEEIHPSEVSENETEAELVGTDHNFAFTLANESHLDRNTARSDEPNELRQVDFVVETVDGGSDGEEPISFGNVRAALLVPTILNAETVDSIPTVAPFTRSLSMEGTDTSFRDDTSAQTGNGSAFPLPLPPPRQTAEPSTRNSSVGEEDSSRPDWLRDSPEQLPLGSETVQREASNASGRSAGNTGNQIVQRTSSQLQVLSSSIARGTNKAFEALFGDAKPPFVSRRRLADGEAARYIVSRTLLPASVIFSQPTKMWIATLQTNQKALDSNDVMEASKSLRAFSLPSERQAKCLAQAWTPPRMEPFANHPLCNTCQSKFAVFRRACHCRNCGVCVCKDCTVTWPAKMVPETYNIKKTATVNICKACDWLCNSFRLALLEGDQDKAVALYATGNINIVCPFGNVRSQPTESGCIAVPPLIFISSRSKESCSTLFTHAFSVSHFRSCDG